MSVFAPFRFSPVNNWVYFPDWADEVSHDVPFKDGLSGSIELEILARSEVLIGGPRRTATQDVAGEVWPFQLPDERYAIPPSSLQGLVRTHVETIGFGAMGEFVDNKRFSIRDLTEAAKPIYRDRVGSPEAGWLRRVNGQLEFRRCELERITFDEVGRLVGVTTNTSQNANEHGSADNVARKLGERSSAPARYGYVKDKLRLFRKNLLLGSQTVKGCVVLTGNASNKKREFVFHTPSPVSDTGAISEALFEEFLSIHDPDDGRKKNDAWLYFRDKGYPVDPFTGGGNKSFKNGGWMPIFYIKDGDRIDSFGLAFMFKMAHKNSTHALLKNSTPAHLDSPHDLASLIFGRVANSADTGGLKGRAAFDLAMAELPEGQTAKSARIAVVPSSPKPSYYPIYVTQPSKPNGPPGELPTHHRDTVPYASYTPLTRPFKPHKTPTLAGRKIWPDTRQAAADHTDGEAYTWGTLPKPPNLPNKSKKTHIRLNALPAGTSFKTVLRFHNLKPAELGALLWVLGCGEPDFVRANRGDEFPDRTLRIGAGKPYGLGHVSIRITGSELIMNDYGAAPLPLTDCWKAFEKAVSDAYKSAKDTEGIWRDSSQVQAFVAASNAARNADLDFRYMQLGQGGRKATDDTYIGEKKAGRFLPEYP